MAIFLAEAPGSTNKELIIRSPTQLTVRVTTTAIVHVKSISINSVLMPRLFAKEVFKLVISSLLKIKYHKIITAINTNISSSISEPVMLSKSPTKYEENLLRLLE